MAPSARVPDLDVEVDSTFIAGGCIAITSSVGVNVEELLGLAGNALILHAAAALEKDSEECASGIVT